MKHTILFLNIIVFLSATHAQTTFSQQKIVAYNIHWSNFVEIADIDNDGLDDFVTGELFYDEISWIKNLDNGNFSEKKIITATLNNLDALTVADLDNDGDKDIVIASDLPPYSHWLENDGTGEFELPHPITNIGGWYPDKFIGIDMNGDGFDDILALNEDNKKIYWIENANPGILGPIHDIGTTTGYPTSIFSIDIDNDQDNDVLFSSYGLDKIAWFENLGNNTWGNEQLITNEAVGAAEVYAADLDGDLKHDVLSTSINDNKIIWYKNNLPDNFGPKTIITDNVLGRAFVCVKDLDNDGRPDVISASRDDNKVAWYKNEGDAVFITEFIVSSTNDQPLMVYSFDLDYDGDNDIISSSSSGEYICWYENNFCSKSIEQISFCLGDSVWIHNEWVQDQGIYYDTLSTVLGGDSTITYFISVLPNPDSIEITGLSEVFEFNLVPYSVPYDTALNYTWEVVNGNIINSSPNMIEVYWGNVTPGLVKVRATNKQTACSSEAVLEVSIGTNHIYDTQPHQIQIIPNPAEDFITISSVVSPVFVEIFDCTSHLVKSLKQKTINISDLKEGIYFVKIYEGNNQKFHIRKLIIMR